MSIYGWDFLKYTNLDSPPFLRRHCIENDEEVGGEAGVLQLWFKVDTAPDTYLISI